jgi:hypothetical protein
MAKAARVIRVIRVRVRGREGERPSERVSELEVRDGAAMADLPNDDA